MKSILTLILVGTVSPFVSAQTTDSCARLQQSIKATYNFKPSQLSDSQQTLKSAAMDQFWEAAKANPKELVPCLRATVDDPSADKWFRFDGSNLLLELDPSPASKAGQVRAYTAADLDDVDLRVWVSVVTERGLEGYDVSEAGSRWLAYPEASYFLPEHGAYEVKGFQGALFIFGSMDESQATPVLSKIASQPDHPGREHAFLILMDQATPESLRALKKVDASAFSGATRSRFRGLLGSAGSLKARSKPRTSRNEFLRAFQAILDGDSSKFLDLVSDVPDGEKDVVAVMTQEDLPLVRKVRRMMIARGNQHAIEYYRSFTDILMALVWKPELVK